MARNEVGFALTARELESAMAESAEDEEPAPEGELAGHEEPATTSASYESASPRPPKSVGLLQALDPALLIVDAVESASIGPTPTLSELLELRDRAIASGRRS